MSHIQCLLKALLQWAMNLTFLQVGKIELISSYSICNFGYGSSQNLKLCGFFVIFRSRSRQKFFFQLDFNVCGFSSSNDSLCSRCILLSKFFHHFSSFLSVCLQSQAGSPRMRSQNKVCLGAD